MRSVEQTIQRLIADGFNPRTHGDKSSGLIYAAFQERATRITHGNVGRLALQYGDENLARICRRIAGDESRHETFYTRAVGRMIEQDPEAVVLSLRTVLKGLIAMPGSKMFDGHDPDLFDHFATVSQKLATYTVRDYAAIIKHLVDAWKIADLSVTGAAAKAQDYLCRQPERYNNLADLIEPTLAEQPHRPVPVDPRPLRLNSERVGRLVRSPQRLLQDRVSGPVVWETGSPPDVPPYPQASGASASSTSNVTPKPRAEA